jgi:hypothetical protein
MNRMCIVCDIQEVPDLHRIRVRKLSATEALRYLRSREKPAGRTRSELIRGMITRIIIPFSGYTGRYVWHCNILEHEDNEMVRSSGKGECKEFSAGALETIGSKASMRARDSGRVRT